MNTKKDWAFFEKWATEQGINHNTFLSWRQRRIPYWARIDIMLTAKKRRVKINPDSFDRQPARGNGK